MGFEAVLMSGSGSTVFAITRKKELLRQAEKRFHNKTYFVCCTAIKQKMEVKAIDKQGISLL